jgi:hypothetical protein
MGEACCTHGRNEKLVQTFVGNLRRKDHSEELGVDGRIILEMILEK